jgi:hypothetical protein
LGAVKEASLVGKGVIVPSGAPLSVRAGHGVQTRATQTDRMRQRDAKAGGELCTAQRIIDDDGCTRAAAAENNNQRSPFLYCPRRGR